MEKGVKNSRKPVDLWGVVGLLGPDSATIAKPIILNNPHAETSEQSNIIMTACYLKRLGYRLNDSNEVCVRMNENLQAHKNELFLCHLKKQTKK